MNKQGEQIAALPIRKDSSGKLRVLMITSRDTGRWVMPKGWTMSGVKPWKAAAIEALDEAGAVGAMSPVMLGVYRYDKIIDDGASIPCKVQVYPMFVEKLKSNWKERDERTRRWFSLKAAAKRVDEPDLSELLMSLAKNPDKLLEAKDLKLAS